MLVPTCTFASSADKLIHPTVCIITGVNWKHVLSGFLKNVFNMQSCNQPMKKPEALNFNTGTAAANTENNLIIHDKNWIAGYLHHHVGKHGC